MENLPRVFQRRKTRVGVTGDLVVDLSVLKASIISARQNPTKVFSEDSLNKFLASGMA
jgi:hypothetical protein